MIRYLSHGLTIDSEFGLPELAECSGSTSAQVTVRSGRLAVSVPELEFGDSAFRLVRGAAVYARGGVAALEVRNGSEIVVDAAPQADPREVRLCILGPALALALHQRGQLVLHATAVEIAGRTVAIAGDHGQGKSTLGTALARSGGRLIADDLCAVELAGPRAVLACGHAQIKLWPDVAARLAGDDEVRPLHPNVDKVGLHWAGFQAGSVELDHLWLLEDGEPTTERPLVAPLAVESVMRHWYGSRFGPGMLDEAGRTRLFTDSLRLVERVSVSRLVRPRDLDRLDQVVAWIEDRLRTGHAESIP